MDLRPLMLSCGIELEFLVQYTFEDETNEYASQGLPPAVKVPQNMRLAIKVYILTEIRKVLKAARIPVERDTYPENLAEKDPSLKGNEYLPKRRQLRWNKWVVKLDGTVTEPSQDKYGYLGIEVTSPILDGSEAGFESVRFVINLLTSKFRILVNNTCGLHVHVAPGIRGFDRTNMRRVTGFFYAADRLLATVQPPIRRFNCLAPSIRDRSNVAKGEITAKKCVDNFRGSPWACHTFMGREVRHGELPLIWRQLNDRKEIVEAFEKTRVTGCYQPFQWKGVAIPYAIQDVQERNLGEFDSAAATNGTRIKGQLVSTTLLSANHDISTTIYAAVRPRILPHIAVHRPTLEKEEHVQSCLKALYNKPTTALVEKAEEDLGIFHGVVEIFAAPSSCAIDYLLIPGARMNYNVNKYACYMLHAVEDLTPTVEFREGAGTMDAGWVVTWAKVCHGLTTWALRAKVSEFLTVIGHCDLGERNEMKYDVVDLLDEVGMFVESKAVENRIYDNMAAWRLKAM